jgi:hypothetical protein
MEALHALQLYEQLLVDDDVCSETFVKQDVPIPNWYWHLSVDAEAALAQLMRENNLIDRFEQSRTKLFMYTDRLIDHDPADFILVHEDSFLLCELSVLCESILLPICSGDST